MNEEEKAVLQFMGQVYGETKKHDEMLVGSTANLRPKSNEVKNIFEQTLRTANQSNSQPTPPAPQPAEPALVNNPPIIDPRQAVAELAEIEPQLNQSPAPQPVVTQNVTTESQLEFDLNEPAKVDQIIKLIEQQNKLLTNISTSIQQLCKQINLITNQPNIQSKRNGKSTTRKKSE